MEEKKNVITKKEIKAKFEDANIALIKSKKKGYSINNNYFTYFVGNKVVISNDMDALYDYTFNSLESEKVQVISDKDYVKDYTLMSFITEENKDKKKSKNTDTFVPTLDGKKKKEEKYEVLSLDKLIEHFKNR